MRVSILSKIKVTKNAQNAKFRIVQFVKMILKSVWFAKIQFSLMARTAKIRNVILQTVLYVNQREIKFYAPNAMKDSLLIKAWVVKLVRLIVPP